MAEFCSQCSPFENRSDYNLYRIGKKLKKGRSFTFLCEGCNNRGLYKNETGDLFLLKMVDKEIKEQPININELRT